MYLPITTAAGDSVWLIQCARVGGLGRVNGESGMYSLFPLLG